MRFVIVTVARETGRMLDAILADPWAVTLLLFDQLDEMRYFETVDRYGERLDTAHLAAVAFHSPKHLAKAQGRYERLAHLLPSVSDAKRKGLAIVNADRELRGLPPLKELERGRFCLSHTDRDHGRTDHHPHAGERRSCGSANRALARRYSNQHPNGLYGHGEPLPRALRCRT